MTADTLHIHKFLTRSRANGPGLRAVLWVQGCTLGCPGCFNPETHAAGGQPVTVDALMQQIKALPDEIEGLTVSGGEPLQQLQAMLTLLQRMRTETTLSVVLFSGYTWDEIRQMPGVAASLKATVDILIAGRYDESQRLAENLIGSAYDFSVPLTRDDVPATIAETP